MEKGYLLLETGHVFEGTLVGSSIESTGEVVFNTSMTGYQEIMSDPSYAGQIVVFCYPLIGNYGINDSDFEANNLYIRGIVTGEICFSPEHFQAKETTDDLLKNKNISGITGVDTREIVKVIRKYGSVKGKITKDLTSTEFTHDPSFYVEQVSTKNMKKYYENTGAHIVLIDYGSKKSILNALLSRNCRVTVVPYHTTFEEINKLNPDGVVLSNGPGDPVALSKFLSEIKLITESFPTLGICLGHQLIALAHGAKTNKLPFGHRGANHPVKETETGKVYITSQNHGYVVEEHSVDRSLFDITYWNVNDQTVEGISHKYLPIYSVQFHPEANPGPQDTEHIFTNFIKKINNGLGELSYAAR